MFCLAKFSLLGVQLMTHGMCSSGCAAGVRPEKMPVVGGFWREDVLYSVACPVRDFLNQPLFS